MRSLISFHCGRAITHASSIGLVLVRWDSPTRRTFSATQRRSDQIWLAVGEIEILKDIKANHVIFVKEGEGITRTMHFQKDGHCAELN